MNATTQGFEKIIQRFCQWAETHSEVRAAMVVGSQARQDRPADEWSDLDLIVVTTDPETMAIDTNWLQALGKLLLTFIETNPAGGPERRVLFEGGLDVDIVPVLPQVIHQLINGVETNLSESVDLVVTLIGRGVRILFDLDGDLNRLVESISRLPIHQEVKPLPTEVEFLNLVNDFWYHAVWTAKHLRRGELWWAKGCCDGHMKSLLFSMLTWQAQTAGRDTWFRGRFLEQWVEPQALQELGGTFAHYDREDIWQALFETMQVFEHVSQETSIRLGFAYPTRGMSAASKLVKQYFAGRG
jgi:aminoglycoside 6-adenylyltransferase